MFFHASGNFTCIGVRVDPNTVTRKRLGRRWIRQDQDGLDNLTGCAVLITDSAQLSLLWRKLVSGCRMRICLWCVIVGCTFSYMNTYFHEVVVSRFLVHNSLWVQHDIFTALLGSEPINYLVLSMNRHSSYRVIESHYYWHVLFRLTFPLTKPPVIGHWQSRWRSLIL